MTDKVPHRAGRRWYASVAALISAGAIVSVLAHTVPVQAQTVSTCLSVENNRTRTTSVAVVGFNENSGYWSFAPGEGAVLVQDSGPIRGASFTIRLYDGEGVNRSQQLGGDNKYVSWRYDAERTDHGKCSDGEWVATLHD
jgi:hypothetical protein